MGYKKILEMPEHTITGRDAHTLVNSIEKSIAYEEVLKQLISKKGYIDVDYPNAVRFTDLDDILKWHDNHFTVKMKD